MSKTEITWRESQTAALRDHAVRVLLDPQATAEHVREAHDYLERSSSGDPEARARELVARLQPDEMRALREVVRAVIAREHVTGR